MLENGKIGVRQFTILVFLFTIGGIILIIPSMLASEAKQDAWISAILALGIGVLVIPLYRALGSRFPDKSLVEYSEGILGKWLGKTISLLFCSYFFVNAALTLRSIGEFMTTQIMPETPIQAIFIIYLGIVIMGTRIGLEPLSRAAEIFFPCVIFLFLLLALSLLPQIKIENIQPMLEEGIKPLFRAVIPYIGSTFLELVVFLMFVPYNNRIQNIGKALWIGTLMGGIMLTIISLLTILVIGADLTESQVYPSYVLAKKINVGNFLTRIEVMMAIIWFLTIFFKLTVFLYATALSLAQTLKLKAYRFLTLPLGMILVVFTLVLNPNLIYIKTFNKDILIYYSLTYGLFFPLLLLGVAVIRKKRESGSEKEI
ncbi:endospore germination permease [Peribacillus sp. V2I11]|uniref:GerAB/ArcD/ProY family transporter n=1 Tax=Peribacillus sp. V2I11 TaxID=3042277 RepID=UPI0027823690|nr:endospore germination permease [Peribacillus sp. V2I11]MDQ0883545.1 spore germination protein KB [Peribacillus sp. V2I11]